MPPSLEILNLGAYSDNTNKFTGGIPAEWGSLTNLKELKLVACGLDGACRVCSDIHERHLQKGKCRGEGKFSDLSMCFKIFILCTGNVPATIGNLTNLKELWLQGNKLSGALVGPVQQSTSFEMRSRR